MSGPSCKCVNIYDLGTPQISPDDEKFLKALDESICEIFGVPPQELEGMNMKIGFDPGTDEGQE